jgi:hypothetical protein
LHQVAARFAWSVAIAGALGQAFGCGSSTTCGEGTVDKDGQCVVASGGGSQSSSTSGAGGSGGAPGTGGGNTGTPPKFAGLASISPASTTSVLLVWSPATDDKTAPADLRYAVYLSTEPGGEHFGSPDAIVPQGGTTYLAAGLDDKKTYYAVVHAIDEDGNQDDNTVEKKGVPRADTTPPDFGGATNAAPKPGGVVEVSWSPAADDLSSPGAISYRVWVGDASPVDTTGAPAAVTVPGATTADLVLPIPTTTYHFVVHAVDAAGNEDQNTAEVSSKPGHDGTAPTFAGCTSATAVDAGDIALTWDIGSDDTTPVAQLAYTAYGFKTSSQSHDFTHADAQQTFIGVAGGTLGGLSADTTYYIVCRAADLTGNEDANKHEVNAKTPADTDPPLFNGVVSATPQAGNETTTVVLSWDAATDDQTSPDQIAYDVYQSDTPGGEALSGAATTTVLGTTSATVSLTPATTAYWVVRARDKAGNQDTNLTEASTTTFVSFAQNLQQAWSSVCTNCHTTTHPNGNRPYLDPPSAYAELVLDGLGVVAPGDHANSVVWQFTDWTGSNCPTMPLNDCAQKLTQQDLTWIADWIDQGALNN